MSIKKEPDNDSNLDSSEDEDFPSLPPNLAPLKKNKCMPVHRKSKSIEDRVREQINLAQTYKDENVAQNHIEEKLKLITITSKPYEDPEPETAPTQEEEINIFCVNDSLQFFNVKDVTPVFCGYHDNTDFLTKYEKDMLGLIRAELQNILPSFLLTCHPNCISDCKSFINFLLHNLSISNDAASVTECYHCLIKILDGHPLAEHTAFDSLEVFSLLFNYGIDVENCQLFKWKPGLKECLSQPKFQSKSFNKIPDNWTFNLEFLLKALTKILSTCIVKGEELSNILIFFLWAGLDSRIHSENLFCVLVECIAACIERILEEMLIDIAVSIVKMEFADEKEKWDSLYSFVESIPNSTKKCCLLKKQIGFLALNGICSTKEDLSTDIKCTVAELKLLISQLIGIKSETLLLFAAKFIDLCTCDLTSDIEECDRLCNHLKRIENSLPESAHLAKSNLCKTHARLKRNAFKSSMYALPSFQRRQVYSPIKIKREIDHYPEVNSPVNTPGKIQRKMSDFFSVDSPKITESKPAIKNCPAKPQLFSDPAVTRIKCEPGVDSSPVTSCGVVISSVVSCADPDLTSNQQGPSQVPGTSQTLQSCESDEETILPDLPNTSFVSSPVVIKSETDSADTEPATTPPGVKEELLSAVSQPCVIESPYSAAVTQPCVIESTYSSAASQHCVIESTYSSAASQPCVIESTYSAAASQPCVIESTYSSAVSQPCVIESTYSSAVSQPCLEETSYPFEDQDCPTPKIVSVESRAVEDDPRSNAAMDWDKQPSTSDSTFLPLSEVSNEQSRTSDATFLPFPKSFNEQSKPSGQTFTPFTKGYKEPSQLLDSNSQPPHGGQSKPFSSIRDSIRDLFTSNSNPASSSEGKSGYKRMSSASRKVVNSSRMCVDSFVKQILIDIENPNIIESSNSASFDTFPLLKPTQVVPSGSYNEDPSYNEEDEIMILEEVKAPEKRDKSYPSSGSTISKYLNKSKQSVTVPAKDVFTEHDKRDRVTTSNKSSDLNTSKSQGRTGIELTIVSPTSASKSDKRPSIITQASSIQQNYQSGQSKAVAENEITILKEVKSPARKKPPKPSYKEKSQPVVPSSTSSANDSTSKFKHIFPFGKDLVVKEIPVAPSPVKVPPKKSTEIEMLSKRLGLSITAIKNTNEPEDGDEIVVVKEVQPLNVKKSPPKKKQKLKDDDEDIFFMRQSMGHKVKPDLPIVVDFQVVLALNSVLSEVEKLCRSESDIQDDTSVILPTNIPGLECVPLNISCDDSSRNMANNSLKFPESALYSEDSTDRLISSGEALESIVQQVSVKPYLVDGNLDYAETLVAAESTLESIIQEVSFDDTLTNPVDNMCSRQADVNMVIKNLIEVALKESMLSLGELDNSSVSSCQLNTENNDNEVSVLVSSLVQKVLLNYENKKEHFISELPLKYSASSITKNVTISMSLSDSMEIGDEIECNMPSNVSRSLAVDAVLKYLIKEVCLKEVTFNSTGCSTSESDSFLQGYSLNPNFYFKISSEQGLFTTSTQNQNQNVIAKELITVRGNHLTASLSNNNDNLEIGDSINDPVVISNRGICMSIVAENSVQKFVENKPVDEITYSAHISDYHLELDIHENEKLLIKKEAAETLESLLESVVVLSKPSALKGSDVNNKVTYPESKQVENSTPVLDSAEVNKENSLHISPHVSMSLLKVTKKKRALKAMRSKRKSTCSPIILHLHKQRSPKKLSHASPLNSANMCNKECSTAQILSAQKELLTNELAGKIPYQENSNELSKHFDSNGDEREDSSEFSLSNPRLSVKRKSPDFQDSVSKISCLSSPSKNGTEIRTPSKYKPYPSKLYHSPKKSNFFARSILFSTKRKSPYKSCTKLSPKKPYLIRKSAKSEALLSKTGLALPHLLRQKLLPTSSRLNVSTVKEKTLETSTDSDVEILYEDPKYYADSDCIIVYEKDEVIVLD